MTNSSTHWARKATNLAGALVIVATAWLLWPIGLGGRTQLVVVQGNSMEPAYRSGDLLFARKTSEFGPDDIAVYRIPPDSPGAGALVVHRITSVNSDESFIFTGDNRTTPDAVHPERADLVARPVTNLGRWPTRVLILTPLVLSMVLGCAVVWFLWPRRGQQRQTEVLVERGIQHDSELASMT